MSTSSDCRDHKSQGLGHIAICHLCAKQLHQMFPNVSSVAPYHKNTAALNVPKWHAWPDGRCFNIMELLIADYPYQANASACYQ
ncbi:hypothetical protein T03_3858 [Trichinella britovi]|uniref:Uncharacterized protein n=1 Tax=Trichinella britovi TaxID=45882 RepID=A0A0V1C9I8_TRIBR|nr:hypothetical protein T03_3858 [Trichinella britovi]